MKRLAAGALSLTVVCGWALAAPVPGRAADAIEVPASPFELVRGRLLVPRFLDAGGSCIDAIGDAERAGLEESAELDAVSARLRVLRRKARVATRLERSTLRDDLERLARTSKAPLITVCVHLESARLALRAGFGPEANAELRRAARALPKAQWPKGVRELGRYLEAESLVAMQRGIEGLDAAVAAAESDNTELALAARLRVFDLRTRRLVVQHLEPQVPSTAAIPPAGFTPEVPAPPPFGTEVALPKPAHIEVASARAAVAASAAAESSQAPADPSDPAAPAGQPAPKGESAPIEPELPAVVSSPPPSLATDAAPKGAPQARPRNEVAYALWKQLDELLGEARNHDFDLSSWAVRAGEHALAAGRLSSAHQWFAIAEGVPASRRLAAIRKGDVLVQLGRPDDARRTLQRVVANAREAEVRHLARIRLARYGLLTEGAAERSRLLEFAARSEHPVIESVARDQLALEYLESGNSDAALASLRKIAYSAPTLHHVPRFATTLDAALAATVEARDCSGVLGRLARSWELFLRHATKPEPFVVVGECFVEVGMSSEALRVYRALARSFGVDSVPHLAWRVAVASLVSGDLPAARASLRASLRLLGGDVPLPKSAAAGDLRIPDEAAARWWWLAAEFAAREGRDEEALEIQLALLGSEQLPESLRASLEANLAAQIGRRPTAAARVDPFLAASLRQKLPDETPARALARIQLADRVWQAGAPQVAGSVYRRLRADVDAPTPRSRASYRGALSIEPADSSRELLREAAEEEPFNAWSRLSRVELRMMGLRASVGFPSQVSP